MPQPGQMPVGAWFGAGRIPFNNWGASPFTWFDQDMLWRSPIFDLKPELRNLSPQGGVGRGGNAQAAFNAVPIWGGSKMLRVQLSNLEANANCLSDIVFQECEFGAVSASGLLQQILPDTDITTHVNNPQDSCILTFNPNGQVNAVRFWQCQLRVGRSFNNGFALPTYFLDAGYY